MLLVIVHYILWYQCRNTLAASYSHRQELILNGSKQSKIANVEESEIKSARERERAAFAVYNMHIKYEIFIYLTFNYKEIKKKVTRYLFLK